MLLAVAQSHPWVFIPILLLLAAFIVFFVVGCLYWLQLRGIHRSLTNISRQRSPEQVRNEIEGIFGKGFVFTKHLGHLWKEYRDTLHEQRSQHDGSMVVTAIRATVPSEVFLNTQSVVDSRLHTEFFKHVPGLFTGLGIIGTFHGLILGLGAFQVSDDASIVRGSLEKLMHVVGNAFVVSAFAIAAAMVVTFLEKLIVAALYRQSDKISHEIDSRFDMGAGEEYLSKLVKHSEASATHAGQLKDVLVKELGDILREISANQIQESKRQNDALGTSITQSIQQSLQAPLEKIAGSVQSATSGQSDMVTRMLSDVMAGFSQQLKELFGGQISGITQLNQQTGQAMQDAVSALNALVGNLEKSSRNATNDMTQSMSLASGRMEQHLKEISERLQETLQGMSKAVQGDIGKMTTASGAIVNSVSALSGDIQASVERMQDSVIRLATAADAFSNAGNQVSGVMDKASGVTTKLTEISGSLITSSNALQESLGDYQRLRESATDMFTQLSLLVASAKSEASLTGDRLKKIEDAAQALSNAQTQADEYLQGVNRVLAQTHESFATEVTKTLNTANVGFHEKLSTAVKMLAASITELETTLATSGAKK